MVIFVTALMVITAGLWIAKQAGQEVDLRMRRDLARQATDIAAAVNPFNMENLSFSADDKTRPVFQRLSTQLRNYAAFTGVKSVYTMALRKGQIVFGPESLPEGHPYASPPGTVYQTPTQKDFDIFTTGRAQVQGPARDEYGTFVTASAPVFDPYTGEVVAVIGIDVDAAAWRAVVRRAQWVPVQPTLVLLLILLISGLIIRYRQYHSPQRKERMRYTETILSAVFLSLMTWVLVKTLSRAERESRYNSFYQQAQSYAAIRVKEFNDLQDRIDQLVSFFKSSEDISRAEFDSYCSTIVQKGVVTACAWLPAVREADVSSFIQKARTAGWSDFSIWQKNTSGLNEPVALRPVYYPALYMVPLAGHETAVGYDLNSEPARSAAIQEALYSGLPTATDPVRLIALTNAPLGFSIVQPVNTSTQKGLAAFVVRPENLLGEASLHNKKKLGIEICLFQLKARGEPVFMAGSRSQCDPACFASADFGLGVTVPVFRFGKAYAMSLTPDEVWLAEHPLRHGWLAGLFGLLITFLFSSVVALITNRHATLERKVESRTAELQASEALLQLRKSYLSAIIENQPGRVWLKDVEGRFLAVNQAVVTACGKQSKEDIIGKTTLDFWPGELAEKYFKNDLSVVEKGAGIIVEEPGFDRGEKRWFETFRAPVFSDQGAVIGTTGYARDITARKQAEEMLQLRKSYLSAIIENQDGRIWLKDAEGRFLAVNHALVSACGRQRAEDIVGKTALDIWPVELAEKYHRDDLAVIKNGAGTIAEELGYDRGEKRWFETFRAPVFSAQGVVIGTTGYAREITARKQAAEALRISEQKLNLALKAASMGVWQVDFKTQERIYDTQACLLFGLNPATFKGSKDEIASVVQPDDWKKIEAALARTVAQDVPYAMEFRAIHPDGSIHHIATRGRLLLDDGDQPLKITGVCWDITDRKQAEAALKESEDRFRMLFNQAPLGYQSLDEEGRFIEVNPAWLETLGYRREEVVGKWFGNFLAPEFTDAFRARFPVFKANGKIHSEFQMIHKNGERRFIAFEGRIGYQPDGAFKQTHCILSDITDRRRMEDELQATKAILQAAMDQSPAGIAIADAPDGRLRYVNDAGLFIRGSTREDVVSGVGLDRYVASWKLFDLDGTPLSLDLVPLSRAIMYGEISSRELIIQRDDDDRRIVFANAAPIKDLNGKVTAAVVVFVDITDLKQAEDALQKASNLLSETGKMGRVGAWEFDIETGRQEWTEEVYRIHEVERTCQPTVEMGVSFYTPESRLVIERAIQRASELGEPYDLELEMITAKGGHRHVHTVGKADLSHRKVFGFFQDITERKQAEARIRQLAQHLEVVREDERKRLSRELHDDIGQILTAIKIDLVVVKDECTCAGEVKNKMRDMQNLLSEGVQCVHTLCRRLRPGALDDLGLEEALAGLIDDWKQRNHVACEFHADVDDEALSDDIRTTIFRMVQEALTNVSRYANASNVEINLVADEQTIHVSITDNGCGMEAGAESKPTSFGLLGMRERVEALGGEIFIESALGKGTRIEGSIPLAAAGGGGALKKSSNLWNV